MAVVNAIPVAGDSLANPAIVDALSTGELCGVLLTFPPVVGSYFVAPYDDRRATLTFHLMTPGGSIYVSPLGSGTLGGYRLTDTDQTREFLSDLSGRVVQSEWFAFHDTGAPVVILVQSSRCDRPARICQPVPDRPGNPGETPGVTITPAYLPAPYRRRYGAWIPNTLSNPYKGRKV